MSKAGQSINKHGMDFYKTNMDKTQLYPGVEFKDVRDAEGFVDTAGKFIDYAQGVAGSQVMVLLQAVASGGGAGALAAVLAKKGIGKVAKRKLVASASALGGKASVMQMESGLNYAGLLDEHGVDAPFSSLAFGTLAASVEGLGGNFKVVDDFIKGIASGAKGHVIKRLAANVLDIMPAEIGQEMFQEVTSILNVVLNTDEKLLTKENMGQILESGMAAIIMSGGGATLKTGTSYLPQSSTKDDTKDDTKDEAEKPLSTKLTDTATEESQDLPPETETVEQIKLSEDLTGDEKIETVGVPFQAKQEDKAGNDYNEGEPKDVAVAQYDTEQKQKAYEAIRKCLGGLN